MYQVCDWAWDTPLAISLSAPPRFPLVSHFPAKPVKVRINNRLCYACVSKLEANLLDIVVPYSYLYNWQLICRMPITQPGRVTAKKHETASLRSQSSRNDIRIIEHGACGQLQALLVPLLVCPEWEIGVVPVALPPA